MVTLSVVIEKLRQVAVFAPEHAGGEALPDLMESYEDLLGSYPKIKDFPIYLEFLRTTAGAHIHNTDFSLVLYGLGGYVVPSFEEGLFLDKERYFLFGEVLYTSQPDATYFFAFDFQSKRDIVYVSKNEGATYTSCTPSFIDLLLDFASARYPGHVA